MSSTFLGSAEAFSSLTDRAQESYPKRNIQARFSFSLETKDVVTHNGLEIAPLKANSQHQMTEKESPEGEASPVCYYSNADMSNRQLIPGDYRKLSSCEHISVWAGA